MMKSQKMMQISIFVHIDSFKHNEYKEDRF